MTVTVTASPAKGLDATLDLAEKLAGLGYQVVPHLSARLVRDDAHLADIVARLNACGVDDVFVPAGDADPPAGRFDSALSLLERLAEMGNPFARTGITGYPETHPRIGDDITIQAMWDKRRLAAYIVSNLCFDPATVRRWVSRVRARGVTLPLYVGLAGPVERARLLRMAAKAGASESARFLAGHVEWFLRFGTPGGYQPGAPARPAGARRHRTGRRGRGAAPLHVQPGPADRTVAQGTPGPYRRNSCARAPMTGRAARARHRPSSVAG